MNLLEVAELLERAYSIEPSPGRRVYTDAKAAEAVRWLHEAAGVPTLVAVDLAAFLDGRLGQGEEEATSEEETAPRKRRLPRSAQYQTARAEALRGLISIGTVRLTDCGYTDDGSWCLLESGHDGEHQTGDRSPWTAGAGDGGTP